jgi:hypothetical protein
MAFTLLLIGQCAIAHSSRPQLATGAAVAPDGRLWLVGLNEHLQLFVQTSEPDNWQALSEPRILNTGADQISADGENRPKIAFGPNAWVVISYTQPLSKPYTGFIRMMRSTDQGEHFSEPFTVHHDRQEITHRFESIGFDGQGRLHTLWIDKRDGDGAAIYHNLSADGGRSFGPDMKLAGPSCECCRIALALDDQGSLHALWRHVFGTQTRDHAFATVENSPTVLITRSSFDEWNINACPHHGPGLARMENNNRQTGYHAVWFGIKKEKNENIAAVRYAQLNTLGEPIATSLKKLPDPAAEHADVMAYQNKVAIVWRSTQGSTTSLKAWLSLDGGQNFTHKELDRASGYNDHPRIIQHKEKMAVVWRLQNGVKIEKLDF